MKKVMNLEEKIYFLTYTKPRYKSEISKLIYDKEVKQIYPIINKLTSQKKKWLKEVKVPVKQQNITTEGDRALARKYLSANTNILFEILCNQLEEKYGECSKNNSFTLTKEEKSKLKRYINSNTFKNHVEDFITNNDLKKIEGVWSFLKELIGFHCLHHNFMLEYYKQKMGVDLTTKEAIKEREKDSSLEFSVEYDRLGFPLLKKLSCFDPFANFHSWYFSYTINYVEKANEDIKRLKKK